MYKVSQSSGSRPHPCLVSPAFFEFFNWFCTSGSWSDPELAWNGVLPRRAWEPIFVQEISNTWKAGVEKVHCLHANDCSLIWKSCSWANCFNCQNMIRFCTFLEFCVSVRSCYDISRDCCCVDWLSLWRLQDDEFFLAAVEPQVHRHRTISKVGKFCIIHMPVTSHESWAVDSRCFFIGSLGKSFIKVQTCAY